MVGGGGGDRGVTISRPASTRWIILLTTSYSSQLELTKSNRNSVRKAREAYLIERGKTLEPLGINKKDEM